MGFKKFYRKKDIKNYDDIIKSIGTLEKEKWILSKLKKEILKLKRGEVKPKDTHRRTLIARHFTENSQLLIFMLYKYDKKNKSDEARNKLIEIKDSGELILRENPILQTKSPIDILKWESMPIRYAINLNGTKELRKGYGLHTKPLNEMGLSITIAFMPPNYSQIFHDHPLSEYSFNMDQNILAIYKYQNSEKKFIVKKEEIAYFKPGTFHMFKNHARLINRNMTVKSAKSLLNWRIYSESKNSSGYGAAIKNSGLKRYKDYLVKVYNIKDNFYNYKINLIKIKKNKEVAFKNMLPKYLYVIDGKLKVKHKDKNFYCKRNDIIVVDPDSKFKLISYSNSAIYNVIPKKI